MKTDKPATSPLDEDLICKAVEYASLIGGAVMTSVDTNTNDIALTPKGEKYCSEHSNAEYFAKLAALRKEAVAEIDRLLAFVDDLDGDPDLEEDGDSEPTLGWPTRGPVSGGTGNDGEEEPSLGAVRRGGLRHIDPRPVRRQRQTVPAAPAAPAAPEHDDAPKLPPRYVCHAKGDCLHPHIKDGDRLEISSEERARPGDYVAIWLRPQFVKPGAHHVIVKRLVIDCRRGDLVPVNGERGVIVEMFNPPGMLSIPDKAIRALHKVVRTLPADENTRPPTEAEATAFEANRGVA